MLEVIGLSKRFGGLAVLEGIGFTIERGTMVGMIGPNGAGKTTLFNLLTGFYAPDEGSIKFQDEEISRLSPEQRSSIGISRTFQLVKPFGGMTVLENVVVGALGRTDSVKLARSQAMESLERVGLGAHAELMPSNLTLPDRKRMELARCLASKPKLLLLDEVMCGLNLTDMALMIELIKSLRDEGVTIVVVEHIMDAIAKLSDKVIALAAGHLLAEGSSQEVLTNRAVVEAYLGEEFDDVKG